MSYSALIPVILSFIKPTLTHSPTDQFCFDLVIMFMSQGVSYLFLLPLYNSIRIPLCKWVKNKVVDNFYALSTNSFCTFQRERVSGVRDFLCSFFIWFSSISEARYTRFFLNSLLGSFFIVWI